METFKVPVTALASMAGPIDSVGTWAWLPGPEVLAYPTLDFQ